MKIIIAEYDPSWAEAFATESAALREALPGTALRIEHFGSTSVVGLAAKPVIDVMIGLEDFSLADELVPKIVALGYEYIQKYESVMPYRRFLVKDKDEVRTHNLHMVAFGSEFWGRHLLFRDYLRSNPVALDQYAAHKKELALRDWADVNDYAEAKTDFIRAVEQEAARQAQKMCD